jgi:hypothetical protein
MDNDLSIFRSLFGDLADEVTVRKTRVPSWCKRCGRKHKGVCDLTAVKRRAKGSERMVERYMHSSLVDNEGNPLEGI